LAVLKEQVHQDNLERYRLLKRASPTIRSLELHLAHNGVIVLKLFLDLSQGTAQALSRSHRRAAVPKL
jgi:polyphosphate kinase 2 (PPK2 family)